MTHPAPTQPTRLWRNARLATLAASRPGLGVVEKGAVLVEGERILYAGPESTLPPPGNAASDVEAIDCEGRWITPGLVDCHTHLVYAGDRAKEFEMRLQGATYEQIARAGGGILSTVRLTRAATPEELLRQSLRRLDALIAEGVTTVEVKSGYGLDLETERKMLSVARKLGTERPVTVSTTFLGAHALPPEAGSDKDAYIEQVTQTMLPALASEGLVDAVDAFCEGIAFSPAQVSRVFSAAAALGLPVKLHADQLSNLSGAALAANYRALSADHLEHSDEQSVRAMAAAGTVAVVLPGAFYFLRESTLPPIELLRRHAVPIALATDSNPGTSPLTSLLLAMNMAATQFRLTVDECIAGVTREAARALGMADRSGTLEAGKYADLAVWNIDAPSELVYRIGFNPLFARVWRGR
jgi:imidazolonepropionase